MSYGILGIGGGYPPQITSGASSRHAKPNSFAQLFKRMSTCNSGSIRKTQIEYKSIFIPIWKKNIVNVQRFFKGMAYWRSFALGLVVSLNLATIFMLYSVIDDLYLQRVVTILLGATMIILLMKLLNVIQPNNKGIKPNTGAAVCNGEIHKQQDVELNCISEKPQLEIAERRRIESIQAKPGEQLFHTQRFECVGQLMVGFVHDLNNILTATMGYAGQLGTEIEDKNLLKYNIGKIITSTDKATRLTKGLLSFSRKQINKPKRLDLNVIIKETEQYLRMLINKHVTLELRLADKKCLVMADNSQIEQVLMNLTTNARDAMPDGGFITVATDVVKLDNKALNTYGCKQEGWYAVIIFFDTGIGMDEQTKQKMFEPFFTTKAAGKGTGLGLPIIQEIVKHHNGHIDVYSEPGNGTTFKIYLPIADDGIVDEQSGNPLYP